MYSSAYDRTHDTITDIAKTIDGVKDIRWHDKQGWAVITTAKTIIKVSYELVNMLSYKELAEYLFSSIVYSEHNHLRARCN